MVIRYCVFDKCGNQRDKNSKVSFFSFPKEDELLQKWLNFINKHNKNKLSESTLDRDKMKVCHMHFEKRQVHTKSNNDRALVRNSVPRCPPGVVDRAHALKKNQTRKRVRRQKPANTEKPQKNLEAASPSNPKGITTTLEGNPLYHLINGYVVDLRIAAQQDTFRLPNGKLIQVRRQPKKASDTEKDPKSQSAPVSGSASSAEEGNSPTKAARKHQKKASDSDKDPKSPQTGSAEKPTTQSPDVQENQSATTRSSVAQIEPFLPPAPTSAHSDKASKTYTNRRTLNHTLRTSPTLHSTPLRNQALSPQITPSTPPVVPPFATAPAAPSSQSIRTPIIVPPSLADLQALMHKTHPKTQFGEHLKDFEYRIISTAELSLHIVSKLNNFLHSNPYRQAEDTKDLKDLYHHVAYILKYAVDRFKGLEDNCVHDIQHMGFTKQSDLGPLLAKQTDKTPPKSADMEETTEASAEKEAEVEEEEEEDDDCAIIEERTDVIEVDSDDDDDDEESDDEEEESDDQTVEPTRITLGPKQLRICSDTESIAQDEGSNDSEQVQKVPRNADSEEQPQTKSAKQPIESETQSEEAAQIEVVMNEVEETTIVQDYFYEEVSDEENEDGKAAERHIYNWIGDDEVMDVDDDDASSEQAPLGDGEETEELIEIIEGDIDLDLEDGQEYKVIEVIDGDNDTW